MLRQVVFLTLALWSSAAFCQTAEQILDQVAKRYAGFKSLRVQSSIVMEVGGGGLKIRVTQTHNALYAQPNMVKATWRGGAETFGLGETAIVSDGTDLFIQIGATKEIVRRRAGKSLREVLEQSPSAGGRERVVDEVTFLSGTPWRKIAKNPRLVKKQLLNGRPCFVISLQSPSGSQTLWIGQKDYLLWQNQTVTASESLGGKMTIRETFKVIQPNAPYRLSDFAYKAPPGYKIVKRLGESREREGETALKGKEAPDFQLPDLTGKEVSLSSFKGKPLVINFFAHW